MDEDAIRVLGYKASPPIVRIARDPFLTGWYLGSREVRDMRRGVDIRDWERLRELEEKFSYFLESEEPPE